MKPKTERLGVAALEYFFSSMGWLFREQTTHDYGIDAHVEIVAQHYPSGRLIALQIKSGLSFFSEETAEGYVFRADDQHIAYWLEHSMPVVLVLFNPADKEMYWEHVSRETVSSTGKQWKMLIPKAHAFSNSESVLQSLAALTQPEPYIRRLNRLRIDRHWIELVDQGYEVRVQFDKWVNKSLPRFQVTISCEGESETWPMVYGPGVDIEELLDHSIPWADVTLDTDAHRDGAESDWAAECYVGKDPDDGEVLYCMSFDAWYQEPDQKIVPVSSNGETESYSLILSLNELGKSFLITDDFLGQESDFEKRTFTIE